MIKQVTRGSFKEEYVDIEQEIIKFAFVEAMWSKFWILKQFKGLKTDYDQLKRDVIVTYVKCNMKKMKASLSLFYTSLYTTLPVFHLFCIHNV